MQKIIFFLFIAIFISGPSQAADCLKKWHETTTKIQRLRGVAQCNDFPSLSQCRINSEIVTPLEKLSATQLGARIGARMTVAGVLCAGKSVSQNAAEKYPYAFKLLFGEEAFAQMGDCNRAASVFAREAEYATQSALDTLKQARREKAIEIWAEKANIKPEALKTLKAQFLDSVDNFLVVPLKNGQTARYRDIQVVRLKSPSTTVTEISRISDPFMQARAREFVSFYQNDVLMSGMSADTKMVSIDGGISKLTQALSNIQMRATANQLETNGRFVVDKVAAEVRDSAGVMESFTKIIPENIRIQNSALVTRSIANLFSNDKICTLNEKPNFWIRTVVPEAQAVGVCSLPPKYKLAASEGLVEGAGVKAGARLLVGKVMTGVNVLGLAWTVYDAGKLVYDKTHPCPTPSNPYYTATLASESCKPEMSLRSLKLPSSSGTSFFELPEEVQKSQLGNSEFCAKFEKVFDETLGNKTAVCKGNSVFVYDKVSRISHEAIIGTDQKLKEIRSYGSGMPYGSTISTFNEDEQLSEYIAFAETRDNPGIRNPIQTGKWNVEQLLNGDSHLQIQARASASASSADLSAILEKVGCCDNTLEAQDTQGRCLGVTYAKSTSLLGNKGGAK